MRGRIHPCGLDVFGIIGFHIDNTLMFESLYNLFIQPNSGCARPHPEVHANEAEDPYSRHSYNRSEP